MARDALGSKACGEEVMRHIVTRVEAQVSQNQQCVQPTVLHNTATMSQPYKPSMPYQVHNGFDERPGTIMNARVEGSKSGGDGGARVERGKVAPHMVWLRQHVKKSLTVPGNNQGTGVPVYILLDSRSSCVMAIPEE